MKKFCDNCEAPATQHNVEVSEEKYADSRRSFCECCYQAYLIGLQHGNKWHADGRSERHCQNCDCAMSEADFAKLTGLCPACSDAIQ